MPEPAGLEPEEDRRAAVELRERHTYSLALQPRSPRVEGDWQRRQRYVHDADEIAAELERPAVLRGEAGK